MRPLSPLWRERTLTTTQRAEFLWDVEYDLATGEVDALGNPVIEHRYASFTHDDLMMDEQILDEALEKAEVGVYGEVLDVRIVDRWHATL